MSGADHDRPYLQARIREEIARYARHSHPFAALVFEAQAGDATPIRRKLDLLAADLATSLRPSDIIARAFEDTIVVLLVETDAAGARDALFRLRNMLAAAGGGAAWRVMSYAYPDDAATMTGLPLMTAA